MAQPHLAGSTIPGLPYIVTNSILHWSILAVILLVVGVYIKKHVSFIPTPIQAILEAVYEYIEGIASTIVSPKIWQRLGWFFFILFVYIILANYMGMMPGVESIQVNTPDSHEHTAIFKAINTDINHTLALGILTLIVVHGFVLLKHGPIKWIKHFFHTKPLSILPILIFVGLLELTLEPVKFFVLGLRLFGNIFAGEVLIGNMSKIPGLALPFMGFELLVGFLQAFVFVALSLTYLGLLTKEEH